MPVDLVFTGKQTIDGDTAQVGPGVAKRLDMQLLTYVSKIVVGACRSKRRSWSSAAPKAACRCSKRSLPCLITMLEGNNEMRFATMPNMFRAARHPVQDVEPRRCRHRATIWPRSASRVRPRW